MFAVSSSRLIASETDVYNSQAPLSDHLPQVYQVSVPIPTHETATNDTRKTSSDIEVLVWNVMCRGRAGSTGRSGTALAGQRLTNNGLDCDETVEEYESRILNKVAPLVAKWWGTPRHEENQGSKVALAQVACLQEFPAFPLLQEEAFELIRDRANRPGLKIALKHSNEVDKGDDVSPLSSCVAFMWDTAELADVTLLPSAESTACGALCVSIYLGIDQHIAICSVHFPFFDRPGGARYIDAVNSARGDIEHLRSCASRAGATALVVAGDLNVDVRDIATPEGNHSMDCACFDGSSTFRAARLTTDACVVVKCTHFASVTCTKEEKNTTSIWRLGSSALFSGKSRDVFFEARVARSLQDDPRVWRLDDKALATLGLWPFGDQPRVLGRLLARKASSSDGPDRKRSKLTNPLGLAAAYSSDDEEDSSSSEPGE